MYYNPSCVESVVLDGHSQQYLFLGLSFGPIRHVYRSLLAESAMFTGATGLASCLETIIQTLYISIKVCILIDEIFPVQLILFVQIRINQLIFHFINSTQLWRTDFWTKKNIYISPSLLVVLSSTGSFSNELNETFTLRDTSAFYGMRKFW